MHQSVGKIRAEIGLGRNFAQMENKPEIVARTKLYCLGCVIHEFVIFCVKVRIDEGHRGPPLMGQHLTFMEFSVTLSEPCSDIILTSTGS